MTPSNITVDGAPLEEFIDNQHRAEIRGVLAEQIAVPLNRHQRTKQRENISRSRTDLGQVIYVKGQKETHIVIGDSVFPWHVKAPYVASGCSVLGAIEYNQELDEVKCHECAAWRIDLSQHVKLHKLSARSYRLKHGIRIGSSLNSMRMRAVKKERVRSNGLGVIRPSMYSAESKAKRIATMRERMSQRTATGRLMSANPETQNLKNHCEAQRIEVLKQFAASLGRTPTQVELDQYTSPDGTRVLHQASLIRFFGIPMRMILLRAGLTPRKKHETLYRPKSEVA